MKNIKNFLAILTVCLSCLFVYSCETTTYAQPVYSTSQVIDNEYYYIEDGFEYEYYDTYHKRPVIYINGIAYWCYWDINRFVYVIVPNQWFGYIRHYYYPQVYCRPGFHRPYNWHPHHSFVGNRHQPNGGYHHQHGNGHTGKPDNHRPSTGNHYGNDHRGSGSFSGQTQQHRPSSGNTYRPQHTTPTPPRTSSGGSVYRPSTAHPGYGGSVGSRSNTGSRSFSGQSRSHR